MKIKILILLVLVTGLASAQWTSRAVFPGVSRAKSTSFTINDKIYVLGGVSNSSVVLGDFWEYDMTMNTWTQKPNFPGPERYGAVAFVLGNTGYIATGGNDNGYLDDMWQYNPGTGQWVQRTGLPVGSAQHENQRTEAFGFVINNKAYLGGGTGFVFGANSTNNIAFYDLWEFDPSTNSWTTKADIPDFLGRYMSIGAAVNGKGYVGLGCDVSQTTNRTSFWEYDPTGNAWTAKANFPSNYTVDAGTFVLDSSLYLVGGVNLSPVALSNQVYRYDISTNTWNSLPAYSGGAVAGPFSVSTGTRAFAGGGYNGSLSTRNDVWEFTANTTGISEAINTTNASIYPNPATNNITINSNIKIAQVDAFDTNGKKVLSNNSDFNSIDLQNINAGVYQLRITYKDGSTESARFIKSN